MVRELVFRLRALFRRGALERQLDDELLFHLEELTEELVRSGLSRKAARRRARLEFGNINSIKEDCREARGVSAIETTWRDIRYALRGLKNTPVFACTSVLTLALCIAAASTVLALIHTYFFRSWPASHPGNLVEISATRNHGTTLGPVSYPDFERLQRATHTLTGMAAHYPTAPLFVDVKGHAQEINGSVVSANYFSLLGVHPFLGRFFLPEEDRVPDRDRVVVLGYDFWRTRFQGSRDVLGKSVSINGDSFTVIGVAPNSFPGLTTLRNGLYIPLMTLRTGYRFCDDALAEDCTILRMIGRLAKGRSVQQAKAEMKTLVPPRWKSASPDSNSGITVFRPTLIHHNPTEAKLVEILAVVSIVLLLASCANLAGLLIARGSVRAHEFAVRQAMGASRTRIARQLLTESTLIAIFGGTAGVLLSALLLRLLTRSFYAFDSEAHPLHFGFSLEPTVVAAAMIVSLVAGLAFGLFPALRAAGRQAATTLRRAAKATSHSSLLGRWLIAAQTAVAIALLATALLLATAAHRAVHVTKLDVSHVALLRLRPRLVHYGPEKAQRFHRAVLERLQRVPGVESVGLIGTGIPVFGGRARVSTEQSGDAEVQVGFADVSPGYFQALHLQTLSGRNFNHLDDRNGPAVAMVSESLARQLGEGRPVIGSRIRVDGHWREIVGIVQDVPSRTDSLSSQRYVYTPYWQNPDAVDARLCIQVRGDPAAMLPTLNRAIHGVDPEVPIAEMTTLSRQLKGVFRPLRLSATFVSYAAGLTTVLCIIGLYAALALAVARRRREIGIRLALGAAPQRMFLSLLKEGMGTVLIGMACGLGLAVVGSRWLRHALPGASAPDLPSFGIALAAILAAALAATCTTALRAASVDPALAMRDE